MKTLIVANWKMNPSTLAEAKQLFNLVKKGLKSASRRIKNVEVVICPPFLYISNLKPQISNIKLGAQDCFWENPPAARGAFTGEVSPKMLKDLGCKYVITGHSERRRNLKETDEMINRKLKATFKKDLKPILCLGNKNRKKEEEFKKIRIQIKRALAGIKKTNLKNLIITYEPIWAISTTKGSTIATPNEAKEGAIFIRKILAKLFDKNSAQKIRIIYGGSVDSSNIRDFIKKAKMDGGLVGAASLKPKEFVKTVEAASET